MVSVHFVASLCGFRQGSCLHYLMKTTPHEQRRSYQTVVSYLLISRTLNNSRGYSSSMYLETLSKTVERFSLLHFLLPEWTTTEQKDFQQSSEVLYQFLRRAGTGGCRLCSWLLQHRHHAMLLLKQSRCVLIDHHIAIIITAMHSILRLRAFFFYLHWRIYCFTLNVKRLISRKQAVRNGTI